MSWINSLNLGRCMVMNVHTSAGQVCECDCVGGMPREMWGRGQRMSKEQIFFGWFSFMWLKPWRTSGVVNVKPPNLPLPSETEVLLTKLAFCLISSRWQQHCFFSLKGIVWWRHWGYFLGWKELRSHPNVWKPQTSNLTRNGAVSCKKVCF